MGSVVLIDYGSGNLPSARKALAVAAGDPARVVVSADPAVVAEADRIVLPGVGAFAACMSALDARPGLIEAMTQAVRRRGVPFLGICVGMQLMATRGLEFGVTQGLDWIGGDVKLLEPASPAFKVPHMGWNGLIRRTHGATDETVNMMKFNAHHPLLAELSGEPEMYFTHSFAFHPTDPADVVAEVDHGGRFAALVVRDNMAGAQFHPEKSQDNGRRLLKNFLEWKP